MQSISERIGYRYGIKDALLDEYGATPGVVAFNLKNGDKAAVELDESTVATLGTYSSGNMRVDLRALVNTPHDEEHLYGLIAVARDDQTPTVYGLSRFADQLNTHALWQTSIISGHVASIYPEAGPRVRRGDLPWHISFTPGIRPGDMTIGYSGDSFVDIIAAPESSDIVLPEIPTELWCPPPEELIDMIK